MTQRLTKYQFHTNSCLLISLQTFQTFWQWYIPIPGQARSRSRAFLLRRRRNGSLTAAPSNLANRRAYKPSPVSLPGQLSRPSISRMHSACIVYYGPKVVQENSSAITQAELGCRFCQRSIRGQRLWQSARKWTMIAGERGGMVVRRRNGGERVQCWEIAGEICVTRVIESHHPPALRVLFVPFFYRTALLCLQVRVIFVEASNICLKHFLRILYIIFLTGEVLLSCKISKQKFDNSVKPN